MSGLLPRTQTQSGSSTIDNLSVTNLIVNSTAYIANLAVGAFTITSLILSSLTTPIINGAPNLNIIAPSAQLNGDDIITSTNTKTLTNKTLNSISNSMLVNGVNINSLINQDVRNTSSPSFVTSNITNQVNVQTNNTSGVLINQSLDLSKNTNGIAVQSGSITKLFVGHNQSIDLCYISAIPGIRFLTNNLERLRIPSSGIVNDNSIVNMLGLNGTNMVFKNNIVDTSALQTLSNKSFIDNSTNIVDAADPTIRLGFEVNGLPNTSTNLLTASTANRNITLPDSNTTLVGTNTSDTLINKTINSSANNMLITSTPLVSANINSLINQALLTSSTPTFNDVTLTNFAYACIGNSTLNVLTTTITTANVFVAINIAALTNISSNLFTQTGNTGLTYNSTTRKFICKYSMSMSANANHLISARMTLNGTPIVGTTTINHSHGGGVGISVLSTASIITLSNGNIVDVQITNGTNNTPLAVSWITIMLLELQTP